MTAQVHPLDVPARGSNVRSASERRLGKDGPVWTPSEQRQRDRLMKQFSRQAKGYAVSVSEAYREGYDAIDWSDDGHMSKIAQALIVIRAAMTAEYETYTLDVEAILKEPSDWPAVKPRTDGDE